MLRAAIFDLDGTLLDTLGDLADSTNKTLEVFGRELVTEKQVRAAVGNGADVLFEKVLADGREDPEFREMLDHFTSWYAQHCLIRTGPYQGIMETLEDLKQQGTGMAIVSNKPDNAVQVLTKRFFGEYVETAVGARKDLRKKPNPDTVLEAMRLLGTLPDESLYIGDSEVDFETARNAGIPCALVTWGFRDRKLLEQLKPDFLIDEPMELCRLFK